MRDVDEQLRRLHWLSECAIHKWPARLTEVKLPMAADDVMHLGVREMLAFFDEIPPGSEGHATAVVAVCGEELGLGLMKHCLEGRGAHVQVQRGPCTKGTQKGPRLDRWVRVQGPDIGLPDVLFQVEVKNWSAHAIGGERLALNASPGTLANYKVRNWKKVWDDRTGIREPSLAKLLEPMRPPQQLSGIPVQPLACLWTALHPNGAPECFFSVELPQAQRGEFSRVWLFSMSAYLRTLPDGSLAIEMPQTAKRLYWLNGLMGVGKL